MSAESVYKRKRFIIFSIIFIATACIEFFLILWLWQNNEPPVVVKPQNIDIKQPSVSPVNYNIAVAGNELLATRLNAIQQSDRQYANLITVTTDKNRLDSV